MKRISVFGASGHTGKPFIEMALKDGYTVKALVRTPSKLDLQHSNLEVIQGDILDAAKVEETIKTTEAVIDLIAPKRDSPHDVRRAETRNILHAMQQYNVKRLIILSSLPLELQFGILDPNDKPGFVHKFIMYIGTNPFLNNFMMFLLKNLAGVPVEHVRSGLDRTELIQQSELDWTIVRTPRLGNKPAQGRYHLGSLDANTRMTIARSDVAACLLDILMNDKYIRHMPIVSS